LNVLVVDDHAASRDALREIVEGLGHTCRTARDGLEAWEMLRAKRADVVLSDWQMPRMDGAELCRRVRAADGEDGYTYFVLLTGRTDTAHFLRAMEAGADGCHAKCSDPNEIRAYLVSAARVVDLHRQLAMEKSTLQQDSRRSFRAARTDPLTGIANRLRLEEDLDAIWSHAKRYRRACSVAIFDIDEFKAYNDHFGHLAGDEALRRIARTIRREVRKVDGVYRYGGEEFLAFLPEQPRGRAARAMDRVREAIERLEIPGGSARRVVTVSVGVAELDLSIDATAEAWLARADAALYRAKAHGRNRVDVGDP